MNFGDWQGIAKSAAEDAAKGCNDTFKHIIIGIVIVFILMIIIPLLFLIL